MLMTVFMNNNSGSVCYDFRLLYRFNVLMSHVALKCVICCEDSIHAKYFKSEQVNIPAIM